MPLHCPNETLARQLCRFDDAVGCDRHRCQTAAKVFDGLMVQRIHFENFSAQQRLEVTIQYDLMCWHIVWFALSVDNFRRML